ncbi:MAG: LAGLIDADG family homing endonuclease, partial [Candidatus Nanohaloarchaea archaeon]
MSEQQLEQEDAEAEAETQEEEVEYGGDTKINKVSCKGFKSFQRKTSVPFYEGLTAIVGENGSGKCVTGDSKVVLADGTEKRIDELVESSLEDDRREIDDGFISHEGEESVLSLNPRTLQMEERNILAYVKREAPEKLVNIKTRSGREITATEDHPLFHLNDEGEVEAIDTENLDEGTRIAVPRKIETSSDKVFDTLLDKIEKKDKLYVPYRERFEDLIYEIKEDKTWRELAEDIGVSYNTLRGIRDEQACNAASLIKILRYSGKSDKEIVREIEELKSKNHSKTIKLPSENSPEFSRFLGYMLAEGSVPNSSDQVRFINEKKEIVSNFEQLASEVFDVETNREEYKEGCWDVLIYSQALNTLLRKFGMDGAAGKKISDIYLNRAEKKEVSALLEGLYAGDGYVSDSSVTLTSKSRELAEGIQSLMLRIGVNSNVSEITKSSGDYTGKYHKVSVSGVENIQKLRDNLQIPHQMKQERIDKLVEKRPDTNHDTVEAGQLVKNAVDETEIQVSSRENRKEIPKLEAYCKGRCAASREGLKDVAEKIREEGGETGQIEKLANSDIYWDEITSIEHVETERDWVYDLNVGVGHNYIAENTFVHNSNVVDALSFVFGKRSSSLRAEKLTQLIFNGGENRSEADFAKVTVTLDNSSGIFDE